jgi:ATP-binding cassette, subfamily B, multidrug efflux pump
VTSVHTNDDSVGGTDLHLGRRLLAYARPYRAPIAVAVLLLLAQAGLALVGPILTQRALDVAIPRHDGAMLVTLGGIFVASLLLGFGGQFAETLLTTWVGQRVMSDLRRQLFEHLQRLSVPFFDRQPVGRLVTRITSDVETLNELFSSGVVTVIGDVATLIAISILMLIANWRLALMAFVTLPAMGLVVAVFRRSVRSAFSDIRAAVARVNSFLQEHFSGVRVVQLFDREAAVAGAFGAVNAAYLAALLRAITLYSLFFPVVEFLMSAAIALLLWYAGLHALGAGLTVGILAAFIQLVRRFFQPLQDLSEKFNLLQSAMASAERIFRLLDAPVSVPDPVAPLPLPTPARGEVVFEDVWFRYADDAPWALRGVTFRVAPGETVAVVGHTGAGKSTVLSLLLRLYLPTRGRVVFDGVNIAQVAAADLRRRIGFVPQDLFLFRGDLERNLRLDREVPADRWQAALRATGVERLVERLPGGVHHRVAERGRSLSVGERQLVSFARALIGDPALLLLDEATSAVDPESERQIQGALATLRAGRTALVVAHRLDTVLDADRILVFHHGELREIGTHRELMAAGGLYQRLVRLQRGDGPAAKSA